MGAHWEPTGGPIEPRVLSVAVGDSGRVYAGTENGLFVGEDLASSWRALSGLPVGIGVRKLAVDPTVRETLYAAAGDLYRSLDRGQSWSLVRSTPGFVVTALTVSPSSLVYVGESYTGPGFEGSPRPGGIFKSLDAGRTWQEVDADLPDVGVSALAVDPASSSTIYANLVSYPVTGGVFRSTDSGDSWHVVGDGLSEFGVTALAVDSRAPLRLYAGTYATSVFKFVEAPPCAVSSTRLCLSGGRFRVEVAWRSTNVGARGVAQTMPLTADTGAFWFFQPSNIELVVKVLDGRTVNGRFWVFYGALSNVEYTLTVTDTVTGAVKTYFNPEGNLASAADTDAF